MATKNWLNIDSGNGLLPDHGTKPLPEPMLTRLLASIPVQFHRKCATYTKIVTWFFLNTFMHLPGDKQLTYNKLG